MILLYYSLYKEKPVLRLGYEKPLSCELGQGYVCGRYQFSFNRISVSRHHPL